MNAKITAERATYFTGSAGVVILAGVLVSMVTGLQHDRDRYRAEAARPRPTATVTATRPPAGTHPPTLAAPRNTARETAGTFAVASRPEAPSAHRPGAGAPSGPEPQPTHTAEPPAATSQCGSEALTARALDVACVSIGGSR